MFTTDFNEIELYLEEIQDHQNYEIFRGFQYFMKFPLFFGHSMILESSQNFDRLKILIIFNVAEFAEIIDGKCELFN